MKKDIYEDGFIYKDYDTSESSIGIPESYYEKFPVQGTHNFKDGEDVTGRYELTYEYKCKLLELATNFNKLMFKENVPFSEAIAEDWEYKGYRYWEVGDVRENGTYLCYGERDRYIDQDKIITIHYKNQVAVPLPTNEPSNREEVQQEENFMQPTYTKTEILDLFTNFYVKEFGKLQNPESDPDGKIMNGVTIYGMLLIAIERHEKQQVKP